MFRTKGVGIPDPDVFILELNNAGSMVWGLQNGTNDTADVGAGIAVDIGGFLYLTGYTKGALVSGTNRGNYDIFILQYSFFGEFGWVDQFGTSDADVAYDAVCDVIGNVYVTGLTEGSLEGQNPGSEKDVFVVSDASSGVKRRLDQFHLLSGDTTDAGYGIAFDSAIGRAYVA